MPIARYSRLVRLRESSNRVVAHRATILSRVARRALPLPDRAKR